MSVGADACLFLFASPVEAGRWAFASDCFGMCWGSRPICMPPVPAQGSMRLIDLPGSSGIEGVRRLTDAIQLSRYAADPELNTLWLFVRAAVP